MIYIHFSEGIQSLFLHFSEHKNGAGKSLRQTVILIRLFPVCELRQPVLRRDLHFSLDERPCILDKSFPDI